MIDAFLASALAVISATLTACAICLLIPPQAPPSGKYFNTGDGGFTGTSLRVCSFLPTTLVATASGLQAIGTVLVGEWVWAYNPATKRMELQPILHVWHHVDQDLIDLTLAPLTQSGPLSGEVIHTTARHPFLTPEQGWVPAGKLVVGMHVLRADGQMGIVTGWQVVTGRQEMDNLEVAQDHTFLVGTGGWIVHNNCDGDAD